MLKIEQKDYCGYCDGQFHLCLRRFNAIHTYRT